jgi:hypothetical protein
MIWWIRDGRWPGWRYYCGSMAAAPFIHSHWQNLHIAGDTGSCAGGDTRLRAEEQELFASVVMERTTKYKTKR